MFGVPGCDPRGPPLKAPTGRRRWSVSLVVVVSLWWLGVVVRGAAAGPLLDKVKEEPPRSQFGGHRGQGTGGRPGEGLGPNATVSYSRHSVVRIWPEHDGHMNLMEHLYSNSFGKYDFWRAPSVVRRSVDIRVGPEVVDDLVSQLDDSKVRYSFSTKDLQSSIEAQKRAIPESEAMGFNMSIYHTFDEISDWLDTQASDCGPTCETFSIGDTSEGRPLKVIRIGTPDEDKPVIWVDAGIHAREWIAPATALHIIDKLLQGNKADMQTRYLLSRYVWYILPVSNPDGYVYTWTTDRLWRKTRSVNPTSPCRGADPNRNWDFHWGGKGTSNDPCSENYRGSRPFSEPETRAMARFLLGMRDRLAIYLTLHSYGQYWLTPWGFTYNVPQDYGDLILLGQRASNAMSEMDSKQTYKVGASSRMLYLAAGGSDDWAKGAAGVRYSYTVELADRGRHGFVLPAAFIDPTGAQMFGAVTTLALDVIRKRQEERAGRGDGGQDEGQGDQGQSGTPWTDGLETEASAEGDMDELLATSIL